MEHLPTADRRIAILAHEHFPSEAKTAVGLLRYGDYEVKGILDREKDGERVRDHVDLPDAPIVGSFEALPQPVDALVIGIAPAGGGFEPSWRADVRGALETGCDVIAGLHYPLAEDEEFARLADAHGGQLYDVREPPADLELGRGAAAEADARIVLTAGTDASVGKMTTSLALVEAARERGVDAGFIPTGQTGIMIEGWGIAIDRVRADFVSGAVERMILERAPDHDLLVVEGQGSLAHPAYSADAIGILHGAMADDLVLVHEAGREVMMGFEDVSIREPAVYVDLHETVAAPVSGTTVTAGSVNTARLENDREAAEVIRAFGRAIEAPAADVVRGDPAPILDAILP